MSTAHRFTLGTQLRRLLAETLEVVVAAPRLDPRLLEALERFERWTRSVAEIRRSLVRLAHSLGLPPPSYEHVRRLVRARRIRRAEQEPGIADVALDVMFRARPPQALVEKLVQPRES